MQAPVSGPLTTSIIFSDFDPSSGTSSTDGTLLSLVRFDFWVSTVVWNLTIAIISDVTEQQQYNQCRLSISNKLKPQELCILSDKQSVYLWKSDIFKMDRDANIIVKSPSTKFHYCQEWIMNKVHKNAPLEHLWLLYSQNPQRLFSSHPSQLTSPH